MAVAVAAIPAVLSVGAGVAAGASTFAGMAMIAGGVLQGIGALTKKGDLQKLGGVLSLAGGASAMLGFGGAGSAAGAAKSAAAEAAGGEFATSEVAREAAREAARFGTSTAPSGGTVAGEMATRPLMSMEAAMADAPAKFAGQSVDAVSKAASGMTSNDVRSLLQAGWDRTASAVQSVPGMVKRNPELFMIGAGALNSMYGPEAEMIDWQKSLMQRRQANLNSPIKMGRLS